jgi:5-methylcytosine-specific restriction endonuclease McrA
MLLKDGQLQKAVADVHAEIERNTKQIYLLKTQDEFQKTGLSGWWSPGLTEDAQVEYDRLLKSCESLGRKAADLTGYPHQCRRIHRGFVQGLTTTEDSSGMRVVRTRFSDECRRLAARCQAAERNLRRVKASLNAYRKGNAAEETKRKKAAALELLRAKAASLDGTARDLADSIKRKLATQDGCPYCGNHLGATPHADHIYPLSKGGHSVIANMVMVCAECNIKKGAMTLRAFIIKHKLDREVVEKRLHRLGKDF